MRSFTLIFVVLTVFFGLIPSHGQELTPKPAEAPVFVEAADQPSRLVFPDGRVATLMVTESPAEVISLPFQVTENLCRSQAPTPKCSYEAGLKRESMNFVWTTHPDENRVGKRIEVIDGSVMDLKYKPIDDADLVLTNFYQSVYSKSLFELPPDRIVCDQFAWLPVNPKNGSVKMKIWSGEVMIQNFETGANENQAFFSFSNIDWILETQGLVLQGIRRADTIALFAPLTDTSMVVFDDGSQGCQVNIGASLQQIGDGFGSPKGRNFAKVAPSFIRLKTMANNLYFSIKFLIRPDIYKTENFR